MNENRQIEGWITESKGDEKELHIYVDTVYIYYCIYHAYLFVLHAT